MNIHDATPEEIELFTEDAKRRLKKIEKDFEEMQLKACDVRRRWMYTSTSSTFSSSITIIVPGIYALKARRRHFMVLKGDAGRAFNLVKQVVKIRDFYDPDYNNKREEWKKQQEKALNARRGWGGPW